MPRYHLHQVRRGERFDDFEGADGADLSHALERAIGTAQAMAAELAAGRETLEHSRIEIADESGRVLLSLPVENVVERAGFATQSDKTRAGGSLL